MAKILLLTGLKVQLLKSNPPQILVEVNGTASTPGWTNLRLEVSPTDDPDDDVLEYQFVGDRPSGVVPAVLTSVSASVIYTGKDSERYSAVLVNSRGNTLTSSIPGENPKGLDLDNFSSLIDLIRKKPVMTTLILGEEGLGPLGPDPMVDRSDAWGSF